jgi:hypothetical protein
VIIIGSATLLAIGLLVLSIQAIRIAFSLLKLAYYLIKLAVCLVVLVVCAFGLFCQWLVQWLKGTPEPEPVVTIIIGDDADAVRTIEGRFHRLRG